MNYTQNIKRYSDIQVIQNFMVYTESVRAEPSWPAERILAKTLAAEMAAEFGSFSILGMLIDSLKTEQEFSPCVIKSSFNPANSDCKS